MKISSIEARTCFLFELKMRSKLPFNVTMSKGSITLADYHLAGCSGKQNGKILSVFSPSGFPLGSLNSIIPIKNFPSIQPNPNEPLFSASRECFQSRISPPFCPSIRQIPTSKYPFGTLVPLTPLVPFPRLSQRGMKIKITY